MSMTSILIYWATINFMVYAIAIAKDDREG